MRFSAMLLILLLTPIMARSQLYNGWLTYTHSAQVGDSVLVGTYYIDPVIDSRCECTCSFALSDSAHFFVRDTTVIREEVPGVYYGVLASVDLHFFASDTGVYVTTLNILVSCKLPRSCDVSQNDLIRDTIRVTRFGSSVTTANTVIVGATPWIFLRSFVLHTTLSKPQDLTFSFFDVTGRQVRHIERAYPAGPNEISLDASSLPAGCYWYVLRGSDWMRSGKVMKLP